MAARWEAEAEWDIEPPQTLQTFHEAHKAITGPRRDSYGHPIENHTTTASMWRAYLHRRFGADIALDAEDICILNVLQKVSRDAHGRAHDNRVDIVGFIGNIEQIEQERARRDSASATGDSRD